MPSYKVTSPGFLNGLLYSPDHKVRYVVHTSKPLKKIPSWLQQVKSETPTERKARITAEKVAAKTAVSKTATDRDAVDEVTFTESAANPVVETL